MCYQILQCIKKAHIFLEQTYTGRLLRPEKAELKVSKWRKQSSSILAHNQHTQQGHMCTAARARLVWKMPGFLRSAVKRQSAPQSTAHCCRARPCPAQTAGKDGFTEGRAPQRPPTGAGHWQTRAAAHFWRCEDDCFQSENGGIKRNDSINCARMRGYGLPDQKDSPIRLTANDKSRSMPRQISIKFHNCGYK